ncbi:hypothetical protein HPB50_015407 [Hyalomma asiaticum]|uniref:Uncharacterized protein n=1 Tax=Hyalomma asiaticum TaxID=266040 RepID=A0ACB7TIS5_HYAAI|nr:hypothetical protein HPB50_015407 [Hyalomma asiaticum]
MLMFSHSGIVVVRANRGISAMSGHRSFSLRACLRQSRKYLFMIGVALSMVSLAVVTRENKGSVLHLVAVLLVMASTDSSTLAGRATFYVLSVTGTRLRNLLFACLALSCFLSLLLEETLAVLLIARIISKVVEVLQQESVQVLHQRELFRKTVTRMPALKGRPDLRDSLLKNVAESVLDSPQSTDRELSASRVPASLLQSPEKPSTSRGQRESTVDMDRSVSLPFSNEDNGPVGCHHARRPSRPSTRSRLCGPTAFAWQAKILHLSRRQRISKKHERKTLAPMATFPRAGWLCQHFLRSGRALRAPRFLGENGLAPRTRTISPSYTETSFSNQTVTEASVCSSIEKQFNDDSSLGTRDSQGTSSQHSEEPKADERRKVIWKRVLGRMGHSAAGVFPPLRSLMEKSTIPESSTAVPTLCDGVVAEGTTMSTSAQTRGGALKSALLSPSRNRKLKKTTLLEDGKVFYPGESTPPRKHGHGKKRKLAVPEEDRQEVREIYFWKKERYHTIYRKLLLSVVIMCALASMLNRTSNGGNVELYLYFERSYEKLEIDFIVIVALFALPWRWGSKPPTAGVRFIVQKLPWGAVLTYGTTFTLYFVVKALVRPCNPLYYALPITVAASTSMVFPTSRITIALLSELTDMGPLSMLLYGILMKTVIVICALISVDTLGHQVFNWSGLPAWMLSHHLNASGDWFVSSRQFSTTPYIQHFGAPPV